MEAEIVYEDAILRIAQHRNLVIIAWDNAPTLEHLATCERAARASNRLNPDGIGLMCLMLDRGIPRFTDDVREEVARFNRSPSLFPLGVANVMLMGGIAGIAVRAFVNTAALLGRPAVPTKAFSDLTEATDWLAPRLRTASAPRWNPSNVRALAQALMLPSSPSPTDRITGR
jgi:hypothetical protein